MPHLVTNHPNEKFNDIRGAAIAYTKVLNVFAHSSARCRRPVRRGINARKLGNAIPAQAIACSQARPTA